MDIYKHFLQKVEECPHQKAVVHNGQNTTYYELYRRIQQAADFMLKRGVMPGDAVMLVAQRDVDTLACILAVLHIGGVYVPVDSNTPQKRIMSIAAAIQPRLIVHETDWHGSSASPQFCKTDLFKDKNNKAVEPLKPESESLAYVTFTSGSSGQPKGVKVGRKGLSGKLQSWQQVFELDTNCRTHLQMANIGFDVFAGDWIRALCTGGTLVLCDKSTLLKPAKLYALIQTEQVDMAEFVPATLRLLHRYLSKTHQDLSCMKMVVCGSDSWCMREYIAFKHQLKTRLISTYGLTEASIDSTYFEADEKSWSNYAIQDSVPIGKPLLCTNILILDENFKPLSVQQTGEIYIGGEGIAKGYVNADVLTQERFVKLEGHEGTWFKTGDLGCFLADGNIQLLGRVDRQIKINGNRVELAEIEALLCEHGDIESALVRIEQKKSKKQLVAFVVPSKNSQPKYQELYRFMKSNLPGYMVPQSYFKLHALPMTPHGKVDRNQEIVYSSQIDFGE